MRFHQPRTQFYCGVDLHARNMYVSIIDRDGKTKNDRIDSEKITRLTQSGMLPTAYVYPPKLRGLRDLLRRRLKFVRHRAQLYTHIHGLHTQANLPGVGPLAKSKPRRQSIPANFENPDVRLSGQAARRWVTRT